MDKIGVEAAKKDSLFSMNDRMGLVNDVFALSFAGFGKTSAALNLVNNLHQEEECKYHFTLDRVDIGLTLLWISPCLAGYP